MNPLLLAACFLIIFCAPHRHAAHQHVAADPCAMVKDFDSWGNQDDFVWSFPVNQQHRVLVCLDKLAKSKGM